MDVLPVVRVVCQLITVCSHVCTNTCISQMHIDTHIHENVCTDRFL